MTFPFLKKSFEQHLTERSQSLLISLSNIEQSASFPLTLDGQHRHRAQSYHLLRDSSWLGLSVGAFDPQDFSRPWQAANSNPPSVWQILGSNLKPPGGKLHTSGSSCECLMVQNCISLNNFQSYSKTEYKLVNSRSVTARSWQNMNSHWLGEELFRTLHSFLNIFTNAGTSASPNADI